MIMLMGKALGKLEKVRKIRSEVLKVVELLKKKHPGADIDEVKRLLR